MPYQSDDSEDSIICTNAKVLSARRQGSQEVTAQLTKEVMEMVVAGDLPALEKVKVPLTQLVDVKSQHNAVFFAMLIADAAQCMKVLEYLVGQGLDSGLEDELKQTPLFYAAREGKLKAC